MTNTNFQPTLPAEAPPSAAELDFMELSPPGLFPQNQNSNIGYVIRKLWADKIIELTSQQTTMFNEKFPATSVQFLDDHERQYGLPIAPSSLTLAQRRQNVLNRIHVGPFTKTRRRNIVESFIAATFGTPVMFTPSGIGLDGSGVPLFGESVVLASSYSIRENQPNTKNLLLNGNFENGIAHWTQINGTLAADATFGKVGTHSGKLTVTGAGGGAYAQSDAYTISGATTGKQFTASGRIYVPSGSTVIGKTIFLEVIETGGSHATQSSGITLPVAAAGWNYLTVVGTVVQNDRTGVRVNIGQALASSSVGEITNIDAVQLEAGSVATGFVDPEMTPFFYEVRILNTITPDDAGLRRELDRITPAHISYALEYVATI